MKLFFRRVWYCLRLLARREKGIAVTGLYATILRCRIQSKLFCTTWTSWDELKEVWKFACRRIQEE